MKERGILTQPIKKCIVTVPEAMNARTTVLVSLEGRLERPKRRHADH